MPKKVNHDGLSADNILIPAVYKEIFLDNYRYFILSSGRISGKTSILVAMWWVTINKYPDRDIVVLQATATEIKDSIINEIEKFLVASGFEVGTEPSCEWCIPKSKDRITHRGQRGATYFYPVTDSKGGQRTRGITTTNKLSLVLFEEAQKNRDANVLEHAVATFIRQTDTEAKIIVVGNNETAGHWFVDYVNDKRQDENWCYIYANCFDIWNLLNEQTQEYITNFKKVNFTDFKRMFLGDINASTHEVVFPQFNWKTHYKRAYDIPIQRIGSLIIGIDHATANDTFAVVPVAILADGTAQTLEVCYDDPEESQRSLAPTEQCDILDEFLNYLDEKYGIVYNQLPTYLSIDGAAAPFIQQIKHTQKTSPHKDLWKEVKIKSFTFKKRKYDINLGIIRNALAFNVLTILNEGATMWNGLPNKHRLPNEILKQRFKNGKLDPAIKNDLCDALEYALVPYYSNCYNLSFPVRMKENSHYQDIRRLSNLQK